MKKIIQATFTFGIAAFIFFALASCAKAETEFCIQGVPISSHTTHSAIGFAITFIAFLAIVGCAIVVTLMAYCWTLDRKIKTIAILLFISMALGAKAQTNGNIVQLPITIPGGLNIFTNFPDTTPDLANFEASAGLITLRGSPENYLKVDYNIGSATNFISSLQLGVEIYNAPEASVVDAAAMYVGYRVMVNVNYEMSLQAFARRNFVTVNDGLITPNYSGGAQVNFNWRVLEGNNLYYDVSAGLESPTANDGKWSQYIKVGMKLYFGKIL